MTNENKQTSMIEQASTISYLAKNGKTYVIETWFATDVQGGAAINGENVIEGCDSFDEAMSRAIHHIEGLNK